MSIEVKVVIGIKGDRGYIGVQAPDSDPILNTFEGDLETALQMVPELVENAHQQWSANPRYPKCEVPPPPPTPAALPSRAQRAPTTTQERMF